MVGTVVMETFMVLMMMVWESLGGQEGGSQGPRLAREGGEGAPVGDDAHGDADGEGGRGRRRGLTGAKTGEGGRCPRPRATPSFFSTAQ